MMTLGPASYTELPAVMDFPAREMEFLDGIPAQGSRLAMVNGIPLLLTLGVLCASKRHFGTDHLGPGRS